ncbi:MAG TPA: hypothetical protein VID75_03680 [Acidimicrobiales bacterium]
MTPFATLGIGEQARPPLSVELLSARLRDAALCPFKAAQWWAAARR